VKVLANLAGNLSKAGWSCGYVLAIDSSGRTMWIADAHRGEGKRFIVRADEKAGPWCRRYPLFKKRPGFTAAAFCFDAAARFFVKERKNLKIPMKTLIQFKITIPPLLVSMLLVCFALLPRAQAVSPPPDGGYPNFTTAEGQNALFSLTTGVANTAVGWFSLKTNAEGSFNTATGAAALLFNTADENTAFGAAALLFNTTGSHNTANGAFALFSNIGENNTAIGDRALQSNTTGGGNTATGAGALQNNASGVQNTANGAFALFSNTTDGDFNTASGVGALRSNTTGDANTASGVSALFSNTEGNFNTAIGAAASFSNTEGNFNTAIGENALFTNTTGGGNTAIGDNALFNNTGGGNTAIGSGALGQNTAGSFNIALGDSAGSNVTTANNVICINSLGANVSNSCFIDNIRGVTTGNADAIPVLIDSAGQLGTISSSRRFKHEIKPMDKASESILALKPVTFHYKSDKTGTPQFGLIAEEVAAIDRGLVVRDEKGEIYTVRYDAVNAMLLNEFLKEHSKVEEQQATITELKSTVAQQQRDFQAIGAHQQKQIEALSAGLQKVSAQLQLSKPEPQTVLNNR